MEVKRHSNSIKLAVFTVVAIAAMFYVSHKINTDFSVHAGKDNGWSFRLEWHVYLSVFFFALMCKRLIWTPVFAIAGFITALITVALALFGMGSVSGMFKDIFNFDRGAFLQVVACLMSVAIFYSFEGVCYKTQYNP